MVGVRVDSFQRDGIQDINVNVESLAPEEQASRSTSSQARSLRTS